MEIGDCPKCEKQTMVILGAEVTEGFQIVGLCYNCFHKVEIPAKVIKLEKGGNKSNT